MLIPWCEVVVTGWGGAHCVADLAVCPTGRQVPMIGMSMR